MNLPTFLKLDNQKGWLILGYKKMPRMIWEESYLNTFWILGWNAEWFGIILKVQYKLHINRILSVILYIVWLFQTFSLIKITHIEFPTLYYSNSKCFLFCVCPENLNYGWLTMRKFKSNISQYKHQIFKSNKTSIDNNIWTFRYFDCWLSA